MKVPFQFPPLDSMLSGGLESGVITLIYGEPGTGKTNLCLVLARAVASSGKKVAYVDSEGVSSDRVSQVFADAAEEIRRVLFFRPVTLWEQEQSIAQAAKLEDTGLIILDTFNMMLRLKDESGNSGAGKSLDKQLSVLYRTARERDIPVLMTGQVYGGSAGSVITPGNDSANGMNGGAGAGGAGAGRKKPGVYFGGSAEHIAKIVLLLEKTGEPNRRRALLMKHRSLPEGLTADFTICGTGICEI